jgi:VanZ family protein
MTQRQWRILLFVLMAVVLAFALRPLGPHEGPENWFPQSDKVLHLGVFAMLWSVGVRAGFRNGWALALGLVAYGVGIEIAQSFTPTRSAEVADVLSDSVGIAIGWAGTLLSRRQPQEHRG